MSFDDQKEYDHGDIHKMDDYVNEDHDEEADNSAVSRAVLISEPVCSSDEEYDNVRKSCTQDNQEKHWIKVQITLNICWEGCITARLLPSNSLGLC